MKNIITAQELATLLKLDESTVYKLASSGDLPGFKIGDSWRFEMDKIMKLIRGNGNARKRKPAGTNLEDYKV